MCHWYSHHILTSSVSYYWTNAGHLAIYLFHVKKKVRCCLLIRHLCVFSPNKSSMGTNPAKGVCNSAHHIPSCIKSHATALNLDWFQLIWKCLQLSRTWRTFMCFFLGETISVQGKSNFLLTHLNSIMTSKLNCRFFSVPPLSPSSDLYDFRSGNRKERGE